MIGEAVREILMSFSPEERASFDREIDRRLHPFIGKKISEATISQMVRIMAEEIEMILVARG